jgi:hypothetical protein
VHANKLATYLGCAGLLVGGAGLTYDSLAARAPAAPLFVQASLVALPEPAAWPPADGATSVAYLDEWIELLTPVKHTEAAGAAPPDSTPAEPSRNIQSRDAPSANANATTRETVIDVPRNVEKDRGRRTSAPRADRRRGNAPADEIADDPVRDGPRVYRVERENEDRVEGDRYRDRGARDVEVRVWRERDRSRDRGRREGNRNERAPRESSGASDAPSPFGLFGLFER